MGDPKRSATVLVIDDEPAMRGMLELVLAKAGYRLLSAKNGSEGLALAIESRPDLILLDRGMPAMDGREVLKRLRSTPETRAIPVIMLTALGRDSDVKESLALGADCHCTKPLDSATLLQEISQTLRRRGAAGDVLE